MLTEKELAEIRHRLFVVPNRKQAMRDRRRLLAHIYAMNVELATLQEERDAARDNAARWAARAIELTKELDTLERATDADNEQSAQDEYDRIRKERRAENELLLAYIDYLAGELSIAGEHIAHRHAEIAELRAHIDALTAERDEAQKANASLKATLASWTDSANEASGLAHERIGPCVAELEAALRNALAQLRAL